MEVAGEAGGEDRYNRGGPLGGDEFGPLKWGEVVGHGVPLAGSAGAAVLTRELARTGAK